MVDTPGLLDRPMDDRNQIEMQAIAALEHLGDVLLFLIDRSEQSTTPLSEQENLLQEVRELLPGRLVFVAETKSDIIEKSSGKEDFRISSITGDGLEKMKESLIQIIGADVVEDPLSLPENWPREDGQKT